MFNYIYIKLKYFSIFSHYFATSWSNPDLQTPLHWAFHFHFSTTTPFQCLHSCRLDLFIISLSFHHHITCSSPCCHTILTFQSHVVTYQLCKFNFASSLSHLLKLLCLLTVSVPTLHPVANGQNKAHPSLLRLPSWWGWWFWWCWWHWLRWHLWGLGLGEFLKINIMTRITCFPM